MTAGKGGAGAGEGPETGGGGAEDGGAEDSGAGDSGAGPTVGFVLTAGAGAVESRATAMTTNTSPITMASAVPRAPSSVGVRRVWRLKSGIWVAATSIDEDHDRSPALCSGCVVMASGRVVAAAGLSGRGGRAVV